MNLSLFLSQINNHENKLEGLNNILELSLKSDSKEIKTALPIYLKFLMNLLH